MKIDIDRLNPPTLRPHGDYYFTVYCYAFLDGKQYKEAHPHIRRTLSRKAKRAYESHGFPVLSHLLDPFKVRDVYIRGFFAGYYGKTLESAIFSDPELQRLTCVLSMHVREEDVFIDLLVDGELSTPASRLRPTPRRRPPEEDIYLPEQYIPPHAPTHDALDDQNYSSCIIM